MTETKTKANAEKGEPERDPSEPTKDEILELQFGHDQQLDTMAALSFINFSWQLFEFCFYAKSNSDPMLSFLDWMSLCIASGSTGGDTIATALSCKANRITLYIAKTNAHINDDDKINVERVVSMLRNALALRDCGSDAITQSLWDDSIPITYHKLSQKIEAMNRAPRGTDVITDTDTLQRFNDVVDVWASDGSEEKFFGVLGLASRLLQSSQPMDGNTALKAVFKEFVTFAKETQARKSLKLEEVEKRKLASKACYIATMLMYSDFFQQVHNACESFKARIFLRGQYIQKIWRRIWRVARYWIYVGRFSTSGVTFISKLLGDDGLEAFVRSGDGLRIVWLGKDDCVLPPKHGVKYMFPETPMTRLQVLLNPLGGRVGGKEFDKPGVRAAFDRIWSTSKAVQPFMHCELQLTNYLSDHHIDVMGNCIGVSKLTCHLCHIYVGLVNSKRKEQGLEPWVLSTTSNQVASDWLNPDDSVGMTVAGMIERWVQQAVSTFGVPVTTVLDPPPLLS